MADKLVVVVSTAAIQVRNPSSTQECQMIENSGPGTAFLGQTSAVTTSVGVPFPPGSKVELYKNGLPVWAIAPAGLPGPANLIVSPGIAAT